MSIFLVKLLPVLESPKYNVPSKESISGRCSTLAMYVYMYLHMDIFLVFEHCSGNGKKLKNWVTFRTFKLCF